MKTEKSGKEEKRELILDTAESLMMQISEREISVASIAKAAGIGKGSIYYYFQSKEEILYAVIERAYKMVIQEYFHSIDSRLPALEKIKILFYSSIKSEFSDKQKNLIRKLHVNENLILHSYLKEIAIAELTPILESLLIQGMEEGTIHTEIPHESAEMIVAFLTFILDGTVFSEEIVTYRKLKLFASVLNTCFSAEKGSFDFLFDADGLRA